MVYLQVFRLMLNTYSENSCLSNSSNAEQSVEMRPMPHQATRAFSAKLADVLGRVFQGVEPSVPQVRNTRMNPSLTSNLYSNLRSIFATDAPTPTVSCTSTLRTWPRVAARIGRSSCPTASPPTKLCTLTRSTSTEASPSLSGIIITVRHVNSVLADGGGRSRGSAVAAAGGRHVIGRSGGGSRRFTLLLFGVAMVLVKNY